MMFGGILQVLVALYIERDRVERGGEWFCPCKSTFSSKKKKFINQSIA